MYTDALSLAGLGVHASSLSESMNAIILAHVELNQNSIQHREGDVQNGNGNQKP